MSFREKKFEKYSQLFYDKNFSEIFVEFGPNPLILHDFSKQTKKKKPLNLEKLSQSHP